ncbi:MAG TPA: antibiotic biosynthesis monooxygenase [Kribbella sp.]|nr:antibiotic biosynthesis monooxygenase [Kribbella sp.]
MSVLRMTRFSVDPANADQMLAKRADLIAAVRANFAGLTEARLARVDDETWLDLWRWESLESLQTALAGAPTLPEAAAAFALIHDASEERGELVDER